MLVIAFGSNIGNRYAYMVQARRILDKYLGRHYKQSKVYETKAWGKEDQPAFLNAVACYATDISPEECMEICAGVEHELGRKRFEKWGKRIIDIDILFYGGEVVHNANLQIPHPGIAERAFVLMPLMDVAPTFTHPELGLMISDLYKNLEGDKNFIEFASCF